MERGKHPRARRQRGVTLLEIMVTIAIVAIIASAAVPSFVGLHRQALRATVINDFLHSIYLARSEAIKRNSVVSICRSDDGATCANAAPTWNGGWIVFENLDHDQPADRDAGEPILFRHDGISGGRFTSNRVSFSFRAFTQGDVTGTLIYCPAQDASKDARAIIISHTGRPRTSDRDASGKKLQC